jgi:hypothetical protein
LKILNLNPAAASFATKDGMFPLHLLVGSNSDPTHERVAPTVPSAIEGGLENNFPVNHGKKKKKKKKRVE